MMMTLTRLIRQMRRRRVFGLGFLLLVLIGSIVGNALTFFAFDRSVQPDLTLGDAFWYSMISITTIGYGDLSAATLGSRLGTAIFIVVIGLAAFTSAIGMGVDWILEQQFKERSGMGKPRVKNHLLIVNFPNERRVLQIVEEYLKDERHKRDEIVIVSNQIETLPFALPNVHFVRGAPLEPETYERANVETARRAIVLSTGYDDPNSDSVVASVVHILEHLNPDIRCVAEVLNAKHRLLFEGTRNVSQVYTFRISNNLIVQETQDPGVNLLTHAVTSNEIEGTLISTQVEGVSTPDYSYTEIAKTLLDHDINLVGVIRDGSVHVKFNGITISDGDRLVYISSERHDWRHLNELIS